MQTADFDYRLPPELIAQEPAPQRDASRMMVVHRGTGQIEHRHVTDLPEYLRGGDLMVVNNTRVIPARVFGTWEDTDGTVELLLVEEVAPGEWEALCRSGRPVRPGLRMRLAEGRLRGEIRADMGGGRYRVVLDGAGGVLEILERSGVPPVPPYIKRPAGGGGLVALDRERYQTIFARTPGAVAAPTAGLHFTDALLDRLARRGVARAAVTLHVGPGTFKPVKAERVEDHIMEAERYECPAETADAMDRARVRRGRVLAVGSTTVRTLETVALENGRVCAASGRSSLFIYPPFAVRAVDLMLTNFHLPRSTLLMMVSAFADRGGAGEGRERVLNAYREAVREGYRFYSYGDCMLLL